MKGLFWFFFGISCWNVIVAVVNLTILPIFYPPEALVYVTLTSQTLPVVFPLLTYGAMTSWMRL